MGWIWAFPTGSEKASQVCKSLQREKPPLFGLPKSLQNDNRPSFVANITQGILAALGIGYQLHMRIGPIHFLCGPAGKETACNVEDLGSILGLGKSLEKGKATHSRILAWTVYSLGLHRVGHDWVTFTSLWLLKVCPPQRIICSSAHLRWPVESLSYYWHSTTLKNELDPMIYYQSGASSEGNLGLCE